MSDPRGLTEPHREGATRPTAWTSVNNQSTRLPFEAAVEQRRPTTKALVNHEFPRLPTAVEHAKNVPLQRLTPPPARGGPRRRTCHVRQPPRADRRRDVAGPHPEERDVPGSNLSGAGAAASPGGWRAARRRR